MLFDFNRIDEFANLELILAWRNNPLIFDNYAEQNGIISWDEHLSFWKNKSDRDDYLIKYQDRFIGLISVIFKSANVAELSITIGEISLWNKGLGSQILREFIDYTQTETKLNFIARIKSSNIGSLRIFQKNNFVLKEKFLLNDEEWSLMSLNKEEGIRHE